MYSSFGRKIFETNNANEAGIVINELINKLKERKPSLSEFMAAFEQLNYLSTNTKQSALIRYTLRKIAIHQKLAFADDAANLTIEHIYPQSKINESWDSEAVGCLGNLILLTSDDNGKLKDDNFSQKQAVLKTLNGSVPQDVLVAQDWTIEFVKERTNRLAEIAYTEIWTIK